MDSEFTEKYQPQKLRRYVRWKKRLIVITGDDESLLLSGAT
jgi:hypothetical protein